MIKRKIRAFVALLIIPVIFLISSCESPRKKGYDVKPSDDIKEANLDNGEVDLKQNGGNKLANHDVDLSKYKDADGEYLEIREKVFLSQINDIYSNFEDYANKKIIIEGMFSTFENIGSNQKIPVVYRRGPGCCGNDGWGGFLLRYQGSLPKENDWIRVVGNPLLEKTEDGYYNLYLQVESLEVKKDRGAEFVKQ